LTEASNIGCGESELAEDNSRHSQKAIKTLENTFLSFLFTVVSYIAATFDSLFDFVSGF